jgi:hypothetical protein
MNPPKAEKGEIEKVNSEACPEVVCLNLPSFKGILILDLVTWVGTKNLLVKRPEPPKH